MIDYTSYLRGIIADISVLCPDFIHIKSEQIIVTFCRGKSKNNDGLLAYLIPLRFDGGVTITLKHGRLYEVPVIVVDGDVKLYMIGFVYPRFLNLPLREKVNTIVHELYHISEKFDGDIRRFSGRTYAHSGRKTNFEKNVENIVDEWLSKTSIDLSTLSMNLERLKNKFGKVVGQRVARPKPRCIS